VSQVTINTSVNFNNSHRTETLLAVWTEPEPNLFHLRAKGTYTLLISTEMLLRGSVALNKEGNTVNFLLTKRR
jgi:hypothetical protein